MIILFLCVFLTRKAKRYNITIKTSIMFSARMNIPDGEEMGLVSINPGKAKQGETAIKAGSVELTG
jgi:hypothetical protein